MDRKLRWALQWIVSLGVLVLLIIGAQFFFRPSDGQETSIPDSQETTAVDAPPSGGDVAKTLATADLTKMTAKTCAETFLRACEEGDWETVARLLPEQVKDRVGDVREKLAGIKIIQIGEERQSGRDASRVTVPIEIELPTGESHKAEVNLIYEAELGQWMIKNIQ